MNKFVLGVAFSLIIVSVMSTRTQMLISDIFITDTLLVDCSTNYTSCGDSQCCLNITITYEGGVATDDTVCYYSNVSGNGNSDSGVIDGKSFSLEVKSDCLFGSYIRVSGLVLLGILFNSYF